MIGDSTERKMMRKKAFDNKYLGFKSSTANKAKAMIRIIMPNPPEEYRKVEHLVSAIR